MQDLVSEMEEAYKDQAFRKAKTLQKLACILDESKNLPHVDKDGKLLPYEREAIEMAIDIIKELK